ncbi:histidine phosphatase family protein [Oceanospirillum sediminis]|uniref:Histidine phosphatase family protein n=1 Tax=Oceanospirillum sediminis TaxID=2760088 RepID=A0A839IM26_9GAMM|nr:histidine phosphatase family protein [Oceanospirillum sediminis]MBB1485376.1 histidine phosphatase family protein [Oceanospirillum sediminis]
MIQRSADYLLIRHIRPEAGSGVCYGSSDLPAADVPDPACAFLADNFLSANPDALLLSSPLLRARALTETLLHCPGSGFQKGVQYDEAWQEINFGCWEGMLWDQIPRQDIERWQDNLETFAPSGGESAEKMRQRVLSAWQGWLDQRQSGILVSHSGVIRMIIGQVLDISLSAQLRLQLDYQHLIWLRRTWLYDDSRCCDATDQINSDVWQVRGMNWPLALAASKL